MLNRVSIWILFLIGFNLYGQQVKNLHLYDHPFIQNFSPKEYDGVSQNWGGFQAENGLIYIANSSYILEYDGETWRKMIPETGSYVRAVSPRKEGGLFVAMHADFGYFEADSGHQWVYRSLLEYVPEDKRDFVVILNIAQTEDAVYFGTDRYFYRWQEGKNGELGKLEVLEESNSTLCFEVNGQIYVRKYGVGLTRLEGDSLKLVPGGDFFSERRIHMMLPWANKTGYSQDAILLGVPLQGLFVYDQGKVTPFPLAPENLAYIQNNAIINGRSLSNGSVAMACLQGGIVIMDSTGNFVQTITGSTGLRDPVVINLFEDQAGDVWACLNDGISHIERHSPFSIYSEKQGLDSDLSCVIAYQGHMYMGGALGLYRMDLPEKAIDPVSFTPIPDIEIMVFKLLDTGSELLAATVTGVYQIKDGKVTKLNAAISATIYQSRYDSNIVFVGLADGILMMKRFPEGWRDVGNIAGLNGDYRSIVESEKGNLWAGNEVGYANFQFNFDEWVQIQTPPKNLDQGIPANITYYSEIAGESLRYSNVYLIDSQLIFNTSPGRYRFEPAQQALVPDTLFPAKYPPSLPTHYTLLQDAVGDIWVESFLVNEKYIDWFDTHGTDSIRRITAPFFRLKDIETVFEFYNHPGDSSQVWMAGDNGLVRFDKSLAFDTRPYVKPVVRKLSSLEDSVWYNGTRWAGGEAFAFPYEDNSLRFEYAFPEFDNHADNEYSYKLEGFDEKWSKWSAEAEKEYTNLPEGTYFFKLKGRNVYKEVAESEAFRFKILAPWYRTWWAYVFYVAFLVGSVLLILRWRTQRLKIQNRELEKVVKERTDEVIEAREQMFMQEKMASLGLMTAGIAHEIKNPLNFVNNFAKGSGELAEDIEEEMEAHWAKLPEDDATDIKEMLADIKENAASIRKNGLRADNIINSMMSHAQNTSGQHMPVNLNQLIEENLKFSYQGFNAEELGFEAKIETELAVTLPEIEGVPQELGRVLLNIFQNALYALHQKKQDLGEGFVPKLEVISNFTGQEVVVKIRDNGPGIPPGLLNKIFTPFFTTKPTGKGNTGLGLSISYDIIVQSHKGKLEVNSVAEEFTEFIIRLPRTA